MSYPTRKTRTSLAVLCALCVSLTVAESSQAQSDTTRITNALNAPMLVTQAPGRPNDLFVVERSGTVRIVNKQTGVVNATPFLSIPDVNTNFEGGFLGLAFHPDYATNGKFYVNITTNPSSTGAALDTRIREYVVPDPINSDTASTTPKEILRFGQPQANHNGGWIGFSPTDTGSNLYIMTGDGGSSNDSGAGHTAGTGNAQDITNNLLGKVLRIDVDSDDFPADPNTNYAIPADNPFVGVTGDDEIWSFGLRNPFRANFDSLTGDLYIGDVGQGAREEIDMQPASSTGGENYGWRLREGDIQTPGVGGPIPPDYAPPIYDYPSSGTGNFTGDSVTGGLVYRGPIAELYGKYIFSDFIDDHIWSFDPADPDGTVERINSDIASSLGTINDVVDFGEDTFGNIYIVDLNGELFRVGIPGDINGDGFVGVDDLNVVLINWNQSVTKGDRLRGDLAGLGDGFVGVDDLNVILINWNNGTPPQDLANIPEPGALLLWLAPVAMVTKRS